ncbi:MAG: gamma-glutamylcyclotransferase [Rhodobacteraceae bacterium]|jgi:hypothetical protein|nr:gamma-glutamylcyclotransferase [Paracoccaceae bacterium]
MRYFAYCNLMDIELMRSVCPSARAIAVARLPDHEMRFAKCSDPAHGGCTLARVEGAETWGVHYELSDEDMAALDASAGIAEGRWAHKPVIVLTPSGQAIESVTYHIPNDSGPHAPTESYVGPIHRGAKALGLPEAYRCRLHKIIEEATAAAS